VEKRPRHEHRNRSHSSIPTSMISVMRQFTGRPFPILVGLCSLRFLSIGGSLTGLGITWILFYFSYSSVIYHASTVTIVLKNHEIAHDRIKIKKRGFERMAEVTTTFFFPGELCGHEQIGSLFQSLLNLQMH